jgi:hypothetical protein
MSNDPEMNPLELIEEEISFTGAGAAPIDNR